METLFVGRNLIELSSVDSTNNYSTELLRHTEPFEGTAVWSHEQHSGKGQRGNMWVSSPGRNLTASFIFYPGFLSVSSQFDLNKVAALAVRDCLLNFIPGPEEITVKWPNDVYVGKRKCAGILIENSVSGNTLGSSVIGIGINVNQKEFNGFNACSILEFARRVEVKVVFETLCETLEKRYLQLRDRKPVLHQEYLSHMFRYGLPSSFIYRDNKIIATIRGVSDSGKLELTTSEGDLIQADLKEIVFLAD
jgi:BirA family biotin operon repressor/biotin-[acetyl-CoA-carboxylase] ligase